MSDFETAMTRYGDHQFMDGLDTGLAVAEKLAIWLTSVPPIPQKKLREFVFAEVEAILKKHEHRAVGLKRIGPAGLVAEQPPTTAASAEGGA